MIQLKRILETMRSPLQKYQSHLTRTSSLPSSPPRRSRNSSACESWRSAGSATNTTAAEDGLGRLRLSIDVRFQPASDPVDERWMGPPPWGYRVATYERRGNMPGAVTMAEQKEQVCSDAVQQRRDEYPLAYLGYQRL